MTFALVSKMYFLIAVSCTFQEDEYVQLAAMHYYIQFGSEPREDDVKQVVHECITTTRIENKSMFIWVQLITSALSQVEDRTNS